MAYSIDSRMPEGEYWQEQVSARCCQVAQGGGLEDLASGRWQPVPSLEPQPPWPGRCSVAGVAPPPQKTHTGARSGGCL